jgi:hypothetical protein
MNTEQKPQLNTDQKTQLAESLEKLKAHLQRWEKVRSIAQDILAFINRDVRRFRIEIDLAVGMRFIRIWLTGTERYVYYGESASETTLRQLYERFFEDNEALVNMVRRLAEAVAEIADEKVKELEGQLEE